MDMRRSPTVHSIGEALSRTWKTVTLLIGASKRYKTLQGKEPGTRPALTAYQGSLTEAPPTITSPTVEEAPNISRSTKPSPPIVTFPNDITLRQHSYSKVSKV